MSALPHGPLKGEISLSNGSRIVFDAPVWKLSYHQNQCGLYDSFLQAEERPQNSKDIVGIAEQEIRDVNGLLLAEVIKKNKEQRKLLEEAQRLINDYVNIAHLCEYQLYKRKEDLLDCINASLGLTEDDERPETHRFEDAIVEARKAEGYSKVPVITNGEFMARCQISHSLDESDKTRDNLGYLRYIIFKGKECIGIHDNTHEIREKYNIDFSKGWYPAEINDAVWARAQSLTELQCKINKKQQENTLFSLRLRELIMLAIGRASMCWSEMPRGVYDDTKAAEIGEKLVEDITKIIEANNEKH
jgi:hypothetical protein